MATLVCAVLCKAALYPLVVEDVIESTALLEFASRRIEDPTGLQGRALVQFLSCVAQTSDGRHRLLARVFPSQSQSLKALCETVSHPNTEAGCYPLRHTPSKDSVIQDGIMVSIILLIRSLCQDQTGRNHFLGERVFLDRLMELASRCYQTPIQDGNGNTVRVFLECTNLLSSLTGTAAVRKRIVMSQGILRGIVHHMQHFLQGEALDLFSKALFIP